MSVNIGKIAAVVSASDQSFSSTMKRVERAATQTYSRVDSIAKRLQGSIGGMLGSLAVGATVYQGIDRLGAAIERIDNAGDAADALNLRKEFLMGIQYDARFAGIELDKLIVKMRATIAEAAAGSKQDRGVLEALGLDVDSLARQGTEQQLLAIADAMKAVQDQGERLRLSGAIFGGKGVERAAVANYLGRGSEALMSGVGQAQGLGVAVGGLEVQAVSRASDAIDNAKLAVQGLENTTVVKLAPSIEALANTIQGDVSATMASIKSSESLVEMFDFVVATVGTIVEGLLRGIEFAVRTVWSIVQSLPTFFTIDKNEDGAVFSELRDAWADVADLSSRYGEEGFFFERYNANRRKSEDANAAAAFQDNIFGPPAELMNRLDVIDLDQRIKKIKDLERAENALAAERERAVLAAEDQARVEALNYAAGIAEQVMAEEDRIAEQARERLERIAQIERQSPGGTQAFVAGSNDARIAQFNAAFQQSQTTVQQRQLSTMELIDKKMKEQNDRTRRIETLIDQVVTQMALATM